MSDKKQNPAVIGITAFMLGAASILDLGGNRRRNRLAELPTNEEALRSDWEAIASDFRAVLGDPAPEVGDQSKRSRRGVLRRR